MGQHGGGVGVEVERAWPASIATMRSRGNESLGICLCPSRYQRGAARPRAGPRSALSPA
jgi:hypothetical protein